VTQHVDATAALPDLYAGLLEAVPRGEDAQIETGLIVYEHDGVALEGYYAKDASQLGPRPAVMLLHDWTGVGDNVRMRAQMLARLGYFAFAADIYGQGVHVTGDAASAEVHKYYGDLPLLRSRVRAGFDALAARDEVDASRIAVLGYCFGGTATLEFARTGAPARGFASFHGGLITHEPSDAAAIAAPLLIMTGASDPVIPDETVVAFQNELRTAPDVDWSVISYSGAPHAFTVPGGHGYRAKADSRSWRELVGFLEETIAA
jgi:dienelactone hydrolase